MTERTNPKKTPEEIKAEKAKLAQLKKERLERAKQLAVGGVVVWCFLEVFDSS